MSSSTKAARSNGTPAVMPQRWRATAGSGGSLSFQSLRRDEQPAPGTALVGRAACRPDGACSSGSGEPAYGEERGHHGYAEQGRYGGQVEPGAVPRVADRVHQRPHRGEVDGGVEGFGQQVRWGPATGDEEEPEEEQQSHP